MVKRNRISDSYKRNNYRQIKEGYYVPDGLVMTVNGRITDVQNKGIYGAIVTYIKNSEDVKNAIIDYLNSFVDDIVDYYSSDAEIADVFDQFIDYEINDNGRDFYADIVGDNGTRIEIFYEDFVESFRRRSNRRRR
jgi:hypothetical protein